MEENEDQTYAYEVNAPTSEDLLEIKKVELKEMRIKAKKDRRIRLAKGKIRKILRDQKLDKINLKIKTIKSKITVYNRVGKEEKDKTNILKVIFNLINNDAELMQEIDRNDVNEEYEREGPTTIEDIEKELYNPEVEESHLNN